MSSKKSDVACNYCHQPASLRKGEQIPGDIGIFMPRKYYWICFGCNAWVGCHHETNEPYGTLANAKLRLLRRQLHWLFDPIWENRSLSRKQAYVWLASRLSIPAHKCHIGQFDETTCSLAINLLEKEKSYPADSF